MPNPEIVIGSIFAAASLIGAIGYLADRFNVIKLKHMDLTADSIRAEAWDKLNVTAILKTMDMETFIIKEYEYINIVRDFSEANREFKFVNKSKLPETPVIPTVALEHTLRRLDASPFFVDKYRIESKVIQMMFSKNKKSITCDELGDAFPAYDFTKVYSECSYLGASVDVEEIIDALEYKL